MKPKRGFRQWVRKVEGLPEPTRSGLPKHLRVYNGSLSQGWIRPLERSIDGALQHLIDAFNFCESPQGYEYWESRWDGETPMSDDDYEYLKFLRDEVPRYG